MLNVDGKPLKTKPAKNKKALTLLPQIVKSSSLQRASEQFGQATASLSAADAPHKNVCVLQGEYAEVDLTKEELLLASTDATTCCIIALIAPKQWALIAHLDERCSQQLAVLVPLLSDRAGAAQAFLTGGYGDRGEAVTEELLKALHALSRLSVDVRLAAVGALNQDADTRAIRHRGLALDTATCCAWPVTMQDRGPLVAMRAARPFSPVSSCMEPIYAAATQQLCIPPVHLDTHSLNRAELLQMVALPDAELVQQSSTSPEQEGPGFCEDVRATLRWMLQAKPGRRAPAVFSWAAGDGGWVRDRAAAAGETPQLAIAL